MKKYLKTLVYIAVVFSIAACLKSVARADFEEQPYTNLPKKTTIHVEDEGFCQIGVATATEEISNVRSKNKNLHAKLKETILDESTGGKWYYVELFAKKPGIYKFSYTYTNVNGSKLNKTVKVKATDESPVKYVKIKRKKLIQDKDNYINFDKGKLSVKMKPGYKLKKIVLERNCVKDLFDTNYYTETESIEVHNNTVIDISNQASGFDVGGGDNHIKATSIAAETVLRIIYIDKFSKEEMQINFEIYKPLA